jgi:hypothetical protein
LLTTLQVFFTAAEFLLLERDFQAIKQEATGLIHPKLAKRLRPIFSSIHTAGGEIHSERKAKKRKATWGNGTATTMYLS